MAIDYRSNAFKNILLEIQEYDTVQRYLLEMEGILYIYVIFDHVAAYPLVPICYLLIFAETDLQDVLFRLQALHLLLPRQLSTWLLKKYEKKKRLQTQQREHGQHCEAFSYSSFHRLSPFLESKNAGAPMVVHQLVDLLSN